MKKILFTLAAIALIAASCTKNEIVEPQPRTITVTVGMPADEPQTRVSFAPNTGTPHGLSLKWETGDKLMLNFAYNGKYYKVDAPIVASSISANGKSAKFTVNVPTEIPANATFDLHGVYQRTNTWGLYNGGYFTAGTNTYELEDLEELCITLDKMSSEPRTGTGIIRPMLYFSQKDKTSATIEPINLQHSGWIMAMHFKNSSGAEMDLPKMISLNHLQGKAWAWNGRPLYGFRVKFDVSSKQFSNSDNAAYRSISYYINDNESYPLYGQKLANGASITLYRWVASIESVPRLTGEADIKGLRQTLTALDPRTVTISRVYHVYMKWDGTNLTWGK